MPLADVPVRSTQTPFPQTRCYHIRDQVVTKHQSWPFSEIDFDEVGIVSNRLTASSLRPDDVRGEARRRVSHPLGRGTW